MYVSCDRESLKDSMKCGDLMSEHHEVTMAEGEGPELVNKSSGDPKGGEGKLPNHLQFIT